MDLMYRCVLSAASAICELFCWNWFCWAQDVISPEDFQQHPRLAWKDQINFCRHISLRWRTLVAPFARSSGVCSIYLVKQLVMGPVQASLTCAAACRCWDVELPNEEASSQVIQVCWCDLLACCRDEDCHYYSLLKDFGLWCAPFARSSTARSVPVKELVVWPNLRKELTWSNKSGLGRITMHHGASWRIMAHHDASHAYKCFSALPQHGTHQGASRCITAHQDASHACKFVQFAVFSHRIRHITCAVLCYSMGRITAHHDASRCITTHARPCFY